MSNPSETGTIPIPAGPRRRPRAATERLCRKEEVNMVLSNPFRAPGGRPHVVIPYSYADHEFAQKLVGALRQDRITPWIDEVDMSAGVFLVNRISQAARPVDFVVPAISASSVASSWVQHELRTAMTRNFSGRPPSGCCRRGLMAPRCRTSLHPSRTSTSTEADGAEPMTTSWSPSRSAPARGQGPARIRPSAGRDGPARASPC